MEKHLLLSMAVCDSVVSESPANGRLFWVPDFAAQLDLDLASSFLIISHHDSTKAAL
jgi:hypothetical protein